MNRIILALIILSSLLLSSNWDKFVPADQNGSSCNAFTFDDLNSSKSCGSK